MKTNTKIHSIVLASAVLMLFLILVFSTASAATAQSASLKITTTRISATGLSEYGCGPAIYGNYIVWEDVRNGQDKPDIYMYDVSTSKETRITTSGSASDLAIYGNRIVWIDGRNGKNQDDNAGGHDIYMYDLSTHKEIRITNSTIPADDFGYSLMVAISGNRIMWGGTYRYCIYDLSTRKEIDINRIDIINPAFYGNRIIGVTDIDGRPGNVNMYDLSTYKETLIPTIGDGFDPKIYDNKIVWEDFFNGYSGDPHITDIYMYDISTHKKTRITTHGTADRPAIYGDKILWVDSRTGNSAIYMYDLSTHTETHTSNTSAWPEAIYGDRIVWADYSNGNIYMGALVYSPVASFFAFSITGKTPLTVRFIDKSTGSPASWSWNFGDKSTSTIRNPVHKYSKAGKYIVSLTVKNTAGRNTAKKTSYMTVK
jgi:beta propeller repeat protein